MSADRGGTRPLRVRIPASKSERIRALVLQSFEPALEIRGDSRCEDVLHVRAALRGLHDGGRPLHLGDSGLGFRCLALRASRVEASDAPILLTGSDRLLSRPQDELFSILRTLGARVEREGTQWRITPPALGRWAVNSLKVRGGESSQFASAILLSAIDLADDFSLVVEEPLRSRGYLELTLDFLRRSGVAAVESRHPGSTEIRIPARSRPRPGAVLDCEGDWSTAAGILAVGAATGLRQGPEFRVELEGLSPHSGQPDRTVLDWLGRMGCAPRWDGDRLVLEPPPERLRGIEISAAQSPDLVPVFAALAALAEGRSVFHSAPQLRHKESDRIAMAVKLARFLGARAGETAEGFWIESGSASLPHRGAWSSDRDHRQVMAAFVALAAGAQFSIDDISVVAKSAPEFLGWMSTIGLQPGSPSFILVGHRGTGKSAIGRRLARRTGAVLVDLDEEIEKRSGRSISAIFESEGEAAFRTLEREQLRRILSRESDGRPRIVVVGAGFDPAMDHPEWRALIAGYGFEVAWISRGTDAGGRVFLDRPRLNAEASPLEEYHSRAGGREARYRGLSDRRVVIREGADRAEVASDAEAALFFGLPNFSGASITIPAAAFSNSVNLADWLALRRGWPFRFFEIREDFLPRGLTAGQSSTLLRELEEVAADRLLYSRRIADPDSAFRGFAAGLRARGARLDWALELGEPPTWLEPGDFVSAHGQEAPDLRVPAGVTLKWAPLVDDWAALRRGHEWWEADPKGRVFLPRSPNGRWRHYRLLTARRFEPRLHFLREDEGSAPDQPTLLDWLENPGNPPGFGAVLGKPVFHSRSPVRHGPHFHAFEMARDEWDEAIAFLRALGLDRAAVTSPLKEAAFAWARTHGLNLSPRAARLSSVNTLQWKDDGSARADNTDLPGFESVLSELGISPETPVVLWGGGGTAAMVRELLPGVVEYSAREGAPRRSGDHDAEPEVIIWGVGRSLFNGVFPPEQWRPRIVLDLNYAEDSPGREYALRLGIGSVRYLSGLGLFEAQAALQFT